MSQKLDCIARFIEPAKFHRIVAPMLVLFLASCGVGSRTEDFTEFLTPQKNIVVKDGQSLQFTAGVVNQEPVGQYLWSKVTPEGSSISLPDFKTATVTIVFSQADDGRRISVIGRTKSDSLYSVSTDPIKVLPK
jgi:hypothetical protein